MSKVPSEGKIGLSLRAKSILLFAGLFAVLIILLYLVNRFGLQSYYLHSQLNKLEDTRLLIERLVENPKEEALQRQLMRQCERDGIGAELVYAGDYMGMPLLLFSTEPSRGLWHLWGDRTSPEDASGEHIYRETDGYTISQSMNPFTQTGVIECRGTILKGEEEYLYLLTVPLARIAESAQISNRFLLIIGALILVVGTVLLLPASRHFTEPILQLGALSRQMADLDFSRRFEGKSRDEIQLLGESINHLSDTLESTIADLKQANSDLERDVREKEIINERRRELLANISHELKTPIALIQGYAEGLRDGMCEEEETRVYYSGVILDEAERMNRLVRQLLTLDEMESGKMEAEKTPFNLADLIRDLAQKFQLKENEASARLELDLPEELRVCSDELLVEEILQNYLSNAFHHVKKGGLIRVSAEAMEEGALIRVCNEGEPIPEEALDQIWNKFYKVDKARTRSYGGSGIGLSVVKAAVDVLGGSCRVENGPEGVCFTARI
ncbi:MAG: HAMP domain-containing protein [Lachnospiraceae bacterium]|nr:HAMP domain-containing protein [Lachnospiraceae bacterium]